MEMEGETREASGMWGVGPHALVPTPCLAGTGWIGCAWLSGYSGQGNLTATEALTTNPSNGSHWKN